MKHQQPPVKRPKCLSWPAVALTTLTTLFTNTPILATTPEQARVDDVLGNSSELLIRRDGRRESLQIGSVIQRVRDALITAPPNNARALLRFLSGSGEDLNFYMQTNPHTDPAIYYFPCQVQGGDYIIGWGLAQNRDRGCENGLRVMRGRPSSAAMSIDQAFAMANISKQALAQGPTRQFFYCSTTGGGKQGFATSTAGDPCGEALQQCQTQGGSNCAVTGSGFWWSSEKRLQATFVCDNTQDLVLDGTGETLATEIQTLLTQTQGSTCGLQVYRTQDFMIVPAPDDIVRAQGDDEIVVQTRDTGNTLQVDVLKGAINVRSTAQSEPQLITQGQRYRHREETGTVTTEVTTFDQDDSLTSINMEVLCTFSSKSINTPTNIPLQIALCGELGLGSGSTESSGPIAFCNLEQASGGQEGDRRTVQMGTNRGEIQIDYEMYGVPDRIQIIYEGRELLDTGFISGNSSVSVPFSGKSGRVDVIMTGNESSGTRWDYTLRCPR